MNKSTLIWIILLATTYISCTSNDNKTNQTKKVDTFSFEIKNLTDKEYPDNPDIGFRSKNYNENLFEKGNISKTSKTFIWNFSFLTKESDTISINNINISEFIPTIPEHIKSDSYMSYISCINQEWNRNQVKFNKNEFSTNTPEIVRIDVARNCLNAYLWEIILYIEEDGAILPYSHGWFDFPHDLYAELFEKKNNIPFNEYKSPLEDWVDPANNEIDLSLLRTVVDTININFKDESDQMYPLEGARKKKYKEIIHPTSFSNMRDLQSDSTLFATFTPPGYYNRKDPRTTELGRIYNLKDIKLLKIETKSTQTELYELQLKFSHKTKGNETSLIIGGINIDEFPILNENESNNGWKNSMGIGNHTFYEKYKEHINKETKNSPYYAILLDGKGKWLDSHKIGIDGPIFHFSDDQKTSLHLWLLSFERHALVGHYQVELK